MDNNNLYCRPKFHYSKTIHDSYLRDLLERLFILGRNMACDVLNPYYEEWNKEFEDLYPGINGEDPRYNKFIADKQRNELIELNKTLDKMAGAYGFKIDVNDENCDLIAVYDLPAYGEVKIEMTIELLNEKEFKENLKKK